MKTTIIGYRIDEKSEALNKLILRGIELGTFSHGLYSKWFSKRLENNEPVFDVENYLCGKYNKKYDISVLTGEDVVKLNEIVLKETSMDILNNFIAEMRTYINEN